MTKIVAFICIFSGLIACNPNGNRSNSDEVKPNIIIIMADDMGYFDIGCYGSDIQTPNVDRLAKEGLMMTDFYSAAPNCSPARAGLLTGRTPSRTGVYDWVPANGPMHLPESEVTIAELLKDNGYATCHVGKWHLARWTNTDGILGPTPGDQGFDHWFAVDNNASPNHLNPVNFQRNGEKLGKLHGYSCQLVVEEGITWLKERGHNKKPFFLNVWFNEPHKKLASPPELIEKQPNLSPEDALYYANVENLDLAVGKLLNALDEMELTNNTLVLFTSDNGPWRTESAGYFRGKKSSLYEGGIREPGIIRWPGYVKANSKSDVPAGFIDVLPTICDITDIPLPENTNIDGASILPLLKDQDFEREQALFWFFYKSSPAAVLRSGEFVLTADPADIYRSKSHPFDQTDLDYIKDLKFDKFQLFNLKSDPGQENDIALSHPGILQDLKSELTSIYNDVMDEGPLWEGLPSDTK